MVDGTGLLVVTGQLRVGFSLWSPIDTKSEEEEYRVLVGPSLAPGARAIASVWPTMGAVTRNGQWTVSNVEADIDDETGRVQLSFSVRLAVTGDGTASGEKTVAVGAVGFQVTVVGTPA